ncbi:Caspase activity and apoptosis inhibitor 1 [Halocaridina rubra]|uniref:Caspase activity and apoptosis inhibitor 1 n=1 Tax=Halocaridina rubra TaxID=373956 RepID=A0AAN8WUZ3_HALRR
MENLAHIVQLQGTSEIGLKLKKKKKKKIAKDDSTESEGDNLDLSVEMFPLSHYVSDQEELVNQIFATIRGPKLEGMMPPVLRSIPLNELKKLCLHELRGMSKKRILCIINGQDMDASSESELEDEKGKDITDEKPKEKVVSPKNPPENTNKTDEPTSNKQAIPDYLMKTIKAEPPDDGSPGDKTGAGGKSVLELLELQMRARIIKTMLEKGEDGKALTEGALAALIATPVQPSPLSEAVNLDPVIATTVASGEESKNERKVHTDVEKISKEKGKRTKRNSEGRTVQEEDGRQSKDGHNKSHRSGSRRGYKRHRSNEAKNNDDDGHENKHKRERFSSKSSKTKKKITRKEFEERMKRAKKNRSYRPRKSSEDEEKAQNNKIKDEAPGTVEKSKEGETEEGKKNEGQTFEDKEEGEVGSGRRRRSYLRKGRRRM